MIWLKIFLAVILTTIPFAYHIYVAPRKDKSSKWRNIFTLLSDKFPQVKLFFKMIVEILREFHNGMKNFDSFRKFFILLLLLIMLAYQFVDFTVSNDMAKQVIEDSVDKDAILSFYNSYNAFVTAPFATISSAIISLIFFSYRITNIILSKLHTEKKAFFIYGLLIMVLLFSIPRYFILVEILYIILIAAYFYPIKNGNTSPQYRRTIPIRHRQLKVA